jgi:hypothetical protein
VTVYVQMLLVRWFRRPWGPGSLWSMAIVPGVITAVIQIHDAAVPNPLGFRLETILYSTTALAVGFVAFSLFVLVEEERSDGRGRALRIAGIDGVSVVASMVSFGCLISAAFVVLGVGVSAVVTSAVGGAVANWGAAGLTIAFGVCALVPVVLATALLFPAALSRAVIVVTAIILAWVTNALATQSAAAGGAPAKGLALVAVIGVVAFTALPVVWRRFPARCWR